MNKLLSIFLFASLCCVSCENETMTYDGINAIYFDNDADTTRYSYSFVDGTVAEDTIHLEVALIGNVVNYDREVTIRINETNCTAGVDYKKFPDKFILKANEAVMSLPFVMLRPAILLTEKRFMSLELVPNENFVVNYFVKPSPTNPKDTVSQTRHYIEFSETLDVAPKGWNTYFFSTFSAKKFIYMCDYLEIPRSIFQSLAYMSRYSFYATKMGQHLDAQKESGNTVYEADEVTEMRMGANFHKK